MYPLWRSAIEWIHCLLVWAVVLLVTWGCALTPTLPLPSQGAFLEQILRPLADQQTQEFLDHAKAQATYHIAKWKAEHPQGGGDLSGLGATLGGFVASMMNLPSQAGAAVGGVLGQALTPTPPDPDAKLAELLAWVDTRRLHVRAKLMHTFTVRETDGGEVFAVCTGNTERRYAREAGFPRLDNGPGPCPKITMTVQDLLKD